MIATTLSTTVLLCAMLSTVSSACTAGDAGVPRPDEARPGGDTTHQHRPSANSFSMHAPNISFADEMTFKLGNALFRKQWVSSPSSTTASDGLGPLYNARACQRCHIKDGRGRPPRGPDENAVSMFLRLSIAPQTELDREQASRLGVVPEPVYGTQLQSFAVPGLTAEGQMRITYTEQRVALSDGEVAWLRAPAYSIVDPGYGPLHPQLQLSPRVAPPMIGLGLLEQIPQQAILARADAADSNRDGISGRANRVWDRASQSFALGRFGWKAGNPTLRQQNNSALHGDIGIGNPDFTDVSGDCTRDQANCINAPHGNTPAQENLEASQQMLDLILFYSRHLALPPRPDAEDPEVLAGQRIFHASGCAACHQPNFVTADNPQLAALSNQSIWPYSDLLLHDMGEGLADHRPEFSADGREWRTPPLWGIGLTQLVSGHSQFLHDGRARNLLEAVLWHQGEGLAARERVIAMPATERALLMRFLESL